MSLNPAYIGTWIKRQRIKPDSWPAWRRELTSLLSLPSGLGNGAALAALETAVARALVVVQAGGRTCFAFARREAPTARRLLGLAAQFMFTTAVVLIILACRAAAATGLLTLRAVGAIAAFFAPRRLLAFGLIATIVEATLALRLWWEVTGSMVRSWPTSYLYGFSSFLVRPFEGLERSPPIAATAIVSVATLTAIEFYLVVSLAVVTLVLVHEHVFVRVWNFAAAHHLSSATSEPGFQPLDGQPS